MFAYFLSKELEPFYQNIGSFPTIIFTVLLGVSVVYWAGAVLGIVDIDFLNVDADFDLNIDSPHSVPDTLAALLMRGGLIGVPVVITLTIIFMLGWFICYYLVHFLMGGISNGWLRFLVGIPIFAVSLIGAAWLTSFLIKPMKSFFDKATTQKHKHILGQRAVVRTSRVDANFGEAVLDDGGAGLILKIRSTEDETFKEGDRVVIFERLDSNNVYRVISEEEFAGL